MAHVGRLSSKLVNFASILESNTLDQAINTSTMPFIHPHVALMPDAHLGMGATVGSVIPTRGAIIPAAVGVDIGCGMQAVLTPFTQADLDHVTSEYGTVLQDLHAAISRAIPLSAGKYNQTVTETAGERIDDLRDLEGWHQAELVSPNWRLQLGSLGSGNHFIEVSLDEDDRVWLFLHSGSRGVGNKLAQKHIKIAQEQCRKRFISLPDPDLAYLVEGEPEFWDYMQALRWAQRFAFLNREEMMDRVVQAFAEWIGQDVKRVEEVNCHHNYTVREKHFGQEVWLSRKGAIDAHEGVAGLIPGSMGAASYVVTGKGNPLALHSSPHGAGRNFSRKAARQRFTREDLDNRMQGIAWGQSDAFLDEHPDAYKDIDVVMADAADLVKVEHTLRQIVNVKGD
jgi:tRNA-splicing ligase RtcB